VVGKGLGGQSILIQTRVLGGVKNKLVRTPVPLGPKKGGSLREYFSGGGKPDYKGIWKGGGGIESFSNNLTEGRILFRAKPVKEAKKGRRKKVARGKTQRGEEHTAILCLLSPEKEGGVHGTINLINVKNLCDGEGGKKFFIQSVRGDGRGRGMERRGVLDPSV